MIGVLPSRWHEIFVSFSESLFFSTICFLTPGNSHGCFQFLWDKPLFSSRCPKANNTPSASCFHELFGKYVSFLFSEEIFSLHFLSFTLSNSHRWLQCSFPGVLPYVFFLCLNLLKDFVVCLLPLSPHKAAIIDILFASKMRCNFNPGVSKVITQHFCLTCCLTMLSFISFTIQ